MPDDTPVLYETDYPDMIWRINEGVNNGKIYSPLIPGFIKELPFYYNGNQMTEVIYNGHSLTEFIYNKPT